ncbi:M23 family metallopeptidase [Nitrogeniibacter mangrovi]|uniref:M23 family metallopeptidase n=2 Tax=Nitrogeniibacter mangrovi TaxID=2016596 RepID=A0A6C1BBK7_9RHOO|nr:M23 family metallopeptidase [Nitrogeniibacter mangrovi]
MAFVIHSAKALTQSKVRAIHGRTLVVGVAAAMLLTLAGGVWIGYGLAPSVTPVPDEPVVQTTDSAPEERFMIDKLGKLSGRLFQLESEAETLAERIGVINAFEKHLKKSVPPVEQNAPKDDSLGGPMIPPVGDRLSLEAPPEDATPTETVASIERQLEALDAALDAIDSATTRRQFAHMLFPSRIPVRDARRSSGFGNRYDPFTGKRAFHSGLDFAAPIGTPIYASAGGKVIKAGWNHDYGYKIEIDHGNGLVSRYAHTSKMYVKPGDIVKPGQHIADVGSTGRSTGPHLHFEILENGQFVNPAHYLIGAS